MTMLPLTTNNFSTTTTLRRSASLPSLYYAVLLIVGGIFFVIGKAVSFSVYLDCHDSPAIARLIEDRVNELVLRREAELLAQHNGIIQKLMNDNRTNECHCESSSLEKVAKSTLKDGHGDSSPRSYTPDLRVSRLLRESLEELVAPWFLLPLAVDSVEDPIILHSYSAWNGRDALEKCSSLNLVQFDSHSEGSCTVLLSQKNSLNIQKYMRLDKDHFLDASQPLELVSQGTDGKGGQFKPPTLTQTRSSWNALQRYLVSVDSVISELGPIVSSVAKNDTVIVMVCNFGQADLLANFACSARQRGIDLSSVLVFATDQSTASIASSLGLSVYFDQQNFANLPMQASQQRGDQEFTSMMMAKVICVQMVSLLGYNVLYQDVDMVWYRHPLSFFLNDAGAADVTFQYDHNTEARFAPFAANTGFYFVRANARTQHLLSSFVMQTDLILSTESHTAALTALLQMHSMRYGLTVRVLTKETNLFPSGYHWNEEPDYMRSLWNREETPFLFHMSRTINKAHKIRQWQQMGEWWVAPAQDAMNSWVCRTKPQFVCHDPSMPSRQPCTAA